MVMTIIERLPGAAIKLSRPDAAGRDERDHIRAGYLSKLTSALVASVRLTYVRSAVLSWLSMMPISAARAALISVYTKLYG